MWLTIDPLIAAGVVLATTATDAGYGIRAACQGAVMRHNNIRCQMSEMGHERLSAE